MFLPTRTPVRTALNTSWPPHSRTHVNIRSAFVTTGVDEFADEGILEPLGSSHIMVAGRSRVSACRPRCNWFQAEACQN